jgi:uncharacterized membrane protein (UPF0127 family)
MLYVEPATSPSQWERGLMFRKSLDRDSGMLFVFPEERNLSFWGVNTYLPLDIAFVNKDNFVVDIGKISPMSAKACRSREKCDKAIEANAGYFSENSIKIGDKVHISEQGHFLALSFGADNIKEASIDKEAAIWDRLKGFVKKVKDYILPPKEKQKEEIEKKVEENKPEEVFIDTKKNTLDEQATDVEKGEIKPGDKVPTITPDEIESSIEDYQEDHPSIDTTQQPIEQKKQYPTFASSHLLLDYAIKNKETVRISYRTLKGIMLVRDVEPVGTFWARTTERMIVVTWDQTIRGIREFIIHNVLSSTFKGENFVPKFEFSVAKADFARRKRRKIKEKGLLGKKTNDGDILSTF